MLEDTPVWQTYVADGVQKQWNFTLPYIESTSIKLYISHNGTLSEIEPTLYTFDSTTNQLTYPIDESPAVPAGDIVLLWRETDLTQEEDSTHVAFKSNDIETMVDKLTAICQELADKQSRSIAYDPTQQSSGDDTNAAEYIALLNDYKVAAETAATNAANSATASANSATAADGSKTAAAGSATSAAGSASTATNKAAAASNSATSAANSATAAQGYATEAYNNAKKFIALPVGSIYYSFSKNVDENPAAYRCNGQTITAADQACPALWTYARNHPELCTTLSNWNHLASTQNNDVPKFVVDTTNKTLKLPSIRHWIRATESSNDSVHVELPSLPNITGKFPNGNEQNNYTPGGAFYKLSETNSTAWDGTRHPNAIGFDASRSSAVYGRNSNTDKVVPQSVALFAWIIYRDTIEDLITHNGGTIVVKTYTVQEWAETDPKPMNTLCLIDEDAD